MSDKASDRIKDSSQGRESGWYLPGIASPEDVNKQRDPEEDSDDITLEELLVILRRTESRRAS